MSNIFSFPLGLGLSKTRLPLIPVQFGKCDLCFLIDTGSTHNILFDFVYQYFKLEFMLFKEKQNVIGIEGKYKEALITEATFSFEGIGYTSSFLVLDASNAIAQVQHETGIQIHGVLGTQFLIDNEWIIDFEEGVIKTTKTA